MSKVVYIVDDDPAIRDSLTMLLDVHGYDVVSFVDGEAFLQSDMAAITGPIMLDVRMPGRDGLQVLTEALAELPRLQIIMMSGHGDIAMAVRALKKGAIDFIEKPFQAAEILRSIELGFSNMAVQTAPNIPAPVASAKLDKLTPREREVMDHLVLGKPNKIIASDLGLSVRTVETHRARLLSKLEIRSLSDLVRLSLAAQ